MKTKHTANIAAVQFFLEHAGFSYDPKTETQDEGRYRCACSLAAAELAACAMGISFKWEIDPSEDSSDFSDEPYPYPMWQCACLSPDGEYLSGLGGIDFGRDGEPWGNPERRVIEAQLAIEAQD